MIAGESRLLVEPTVEPISLEDARVHLRLGDPELYSDDDVWLTTIGISAAREWCEGWLERSLAPQTRVWTGVPLSGATILPYGPIISVESISWKNEAGIIVPISSSSYTLTSGRIIPFASGWPSDGQAAPSMSVQYRAGYDSPNSTIPLYPLPKSIRAAILLSLGHLYENRESTTNIKVDEVPLGAKRLLEPFRLRLSLA